MPRVTIGITAYNSEDTIVRALRSALNQKWDDIELVVVDDASSDQTLHRAHAASKGDTRVNIIAKSKNQGVASARNDIIHASTGEFIAFFDDDDVSHPDRLAKQISRIIDYEQEFSTDRVLCYSARRQTLPTGREVIAPTLGADLSPAPSGREVVDFLLMGVPVGPTAGSSATCSLLARRELLINIGEYNPRFRRSEDTEFNVRAALAGIHFAGLSEPLVHQTLTVKSYKTQDQELHYKMLLLELYRDHYPSRDWYTWMQLWLEAKCAYQSGNRVRFLSLVAWLLLRHPVITIRKAAWLAKLAASRRHAQQGQHVRASS